MVGSGQSGCQIAEELYEYGREVHLSIGRAGRLPRRYCGDDTTRWMARIGFLDSTVDQLRSPEARFMSSVHVSGKDGGRTLNLHRFSREGIRLLGHLRDGHGTHLDVIPDLHENLAAANEFAREFKQGIDKFIQERGLKAPADDEPELRDGYKVPVISELDLDEAGINAIVWATGYDFEFSWVKFPILDEFGYPEQERGITAQAELYFLGLHWLHTIRPGLLAGVGDDAAHAAGTLPHAIKIIRRTQHEQQTF